MKTTNNSSEIKCYGRVAGRGFVNEWYETASRHASRRARDLRKLGFQVTVESMGSQVTPIGLVWMTLLSVCGEGAPAIEVSR